jgi:hypothetical protein
MKAFAGRLQDWADIQKVVERQGDSLNRNLILSVASGLAELKQDEELLPALERCLS